MQEELRLSKNTAKLHQMFGKKLYGNKFSFISEICQNAVDSHRMSGEKDPVVVGIRHKNSVHGNSISNLQFYVKDIGLSFEDKEDFINKVCTILESGKSEEKTADEDCAMGMHGIGSISVSAYQPEWKYTVVTRDQKKFTCVLKEVEGKGLTYEMSNYKPCDEFRSVLFEVDLQTSYNALGEFIAGMKEKLCYFKDIMFEFDPDIIRLHKELLTINTDFKIFQAPDFQVSTLSKDPMMHINLDQYSYPIKWSLLGINPIHMNIGLKFSMVDGLTPDITRENLIHSDNYKEIITKKIYAVADWFYNKYNERTPDEFESVTDIINAINTPQYVKINDQPYNIGLLSSFTKLVYKKPKFKGVSERVLMDFIKNTDCGRAFYKFAYEITHGGKKVEKTYQRYQRFQQKEMYLFDNKKRFSMAMLDYLKAEHRGCGLYNRIRVPLNKGDFCYQKILGLKPLSNMKTEYKASGVNSWRKPITELHILIDAFQKETFTKIDDIQVPAKYFKARTKAVRKQKVSIEDLSGEVSIKFGTRMDHASSDYDCKFVNKIVQVRDLSSMPGLYIYGLETERRQLDWLYKLTNYGKKNDVKTCIITETQQVHIKKLNLSNFMNITEFFQGKHDTFRRIVTSYLISTELEHKFPNAFKYKDLIKSDLCEEFGKDLTILQNYGNNFATQEYGKAGYPKEKFMEAILDLAKQGNLYDEPMYTKYLNVKSDIEKFEFIDFFADIINHPYNDKELKKRAQVAMIDVAQQRKINEKWNKYTLK